VRRSATERCVVIVDEHQSLAGRQVTQALVSCGRRQPAADSLRILNPVYVLEQPQPGRLDDVRGVGIGEPEVPRHRPDQPGVLIDQAFPRAFVACCRPAHQPASIRGAALVRRRRDGGPAERWLRA
jgi:hypothetical protein